MGCKIIFSPQAIADLDSLVRFIAKDKPDAALRAVSRKCSGGPAKAQRASELPSWLPGEFWTTEAAFTSACPEIALAGRPHAGDVLRRATYR